MHVQLLRNMVLGYFKVYKPTGTSPEALQNFFDSVINIGLLPPLLHHINSGMHVQLLGNMVLGAFKVQKSTGTCLEALQNFSDSVINIGLLPPYLIISIQECMSSILVTWSWGLSRSMNRLGLVLKLFRIFWMV